VCISSNSSLFHFLAKPSVAKSKTVPETKQPDPQWAHLDLDVFELTEFIYAENPRLFFVRRDYTSET